MERENESLSDYKTVDIVIAAFVWLEVQIWCISSGGALSSLQSIELSSVQSITLKTEKTEHWAAIQQFGGSFAWFNWSFQSLKVHILVQFLNLLPSHDEMAVCAYICLDISTFGVSTCTRPIWTLIFHINDIPLIFWIKHFGLMFQKFWQ